MANIQQPSAPANSSSYKEDAMRTHELHSLIESYKDCVLNNALNNYNETQLRVDYINPFFKLLGWDVTNEAKKSAPDREVIHEAKVRVDENGKEKCKKPDYSFRIGAQTLFFVEAKKPSVNICEEREPAFQLRRYGWSAGLEFSILTNFTHMCIYDCTVRPTVDDTSNTALIAKFSIEEYENQFPEIYNSLSKEALLHGKKLSWRKKRPYQGQAFDDFFLEEIKKFRVLLGKDIVAQHPDIQEHQLNLEVQKFINRILFIRICEDIGLENYEKIKNIRDYNGLKALFHSANAKYDSGLFELIDGNDHKISYQTLKEIFLSLYYPQNSYEFSVVPPHLLGQIYELFLGETLTIEQGDIKVIPKPEVVESNGVVNTPIGIVDIIVHKTLEPLFRGKQLENILAFKVADICCGSGSFLISAYDYIVQAATDLLIKEKTDKYVHQGLLTERQGSAPQLSFKTRRTILENCIYGVDIDPIAVEAAKFSLLLKLIENVPYEELYSYKKETKKAILPNMDKKITTANSLIDYSMLPAPDGCTPDSIVKIRPYDWGASSGAPFDAIVGNPPYVRVQKMVKYAPDEYECFKTSDSVYKSFNSKAVDKYYLFVERALQLLKNGGSLGYIIPHKFMVVESGKALRSMLSTGQHVKEIVHFGTEPVFSGKSTYTCILILSDERQGTYKYSPVTDIAKYIRTGHTTGWEELPSSTLTTDIWTFNDAAQAPLSNCLSLESVAEIFVGLQTSADDVYVIKGVSQNADYIYFIDGDTTRKIEKGILREGIYKKQINQSRYTPITPNCYYIFPYANIQGKAKLIPCEELQKRYPHALAYLVSKQEKLSKRSFQPRHESANWYEYGRAQSLNKFADGEHLLWSVLSKGGGYLFDHRNLLFTGGGNGPYYGLRMRKNSPLSILYIQAFLNHPFCEQQVKAHSSHFRGDYYSHGRRYIEKISIPLIDFDDEHQRKQHDSVVEHVQKIYSLTAKLDSYMNKFEQEQLLRYKDNLEKKLDSLLTEIINGRIEES